MPCRFSLSSNHDVLCNICPHESSGKYYVFVLYVLCSISNRNITVILQIFGIQKNTYMLIYLLFKTVFATIQGRIQGAICPPPP